MHGDYWRHRATLATLNAKGAGVCVMVNRGDGKGRKAATVTDVRAVFLDLDEAPLAPVIAATIPPAIVCESSTGQHHAYSPLADMPLGDSMWAKKSLADLYVGETDVCDRHANTSLHGIRHHK